MNYIKIDTEDVCNGEGLRVVLWLSGCSHRCKGCQNPQTWNANSGIPFNKAAKEELFKELDKDYISGLTLSGGDPLFENNLDGVLDLVTEFNKRYKTPQDIDGNKTVDHDMLNENGNKIRLSFGGTKTIWLYSGYMWEECQPLKTTPLLDPEKFASNLQSLLKKRYEIVKQCDVLVDGRYIDSQRDISLRWCGSKNQRVIDIKETIKEGEIILWK